MTEKSAIAGKTNEDGAREDAGKATASSDYMLPLVNVRVPAMVVNAGFWGGLAGAVALGLVDPPLGVLVGAGVLIARHEAKK